MAWRKAEPEPVRLSVCAGCRVPGGTLVNLTRTLNAKDDPVTHTFKLHPLPTCRMKLDRWLAGEEAVPVG